MPLLLTPHKFTIHRPGAIHRTALLLAAGCTIALFAAIYLISKNAKQNSTHPTTPTPTAPNLANVPALASSQGGLTQGDKFFMQFADRADPTRIAGEVTADTSQPLPERRYQLTKPAAWFFTKDGKSVYVQADEGQMRVASEASRVSTKSNSSNSAKAGSGAGSAGGIETATLTGHVLMRVYEVTSDGSRPDINTATPFATLKTSRISVDWLLGQMDVPESFDATWRTLDYSGQAAVVQFDAQTRIIDSIAIAKTNEVIIHPSADRSTTSSKPTSTHSPNASSANPKIAQSTQPTPPTTHQPTNSREPTNPAASSDQDDDAPSVESFYSINTKDTLTVTQGDGLKLTAASLQAYARLIDGKLARTPNDDQEPTSHPTSPTTQSPQNNSAPTTPPSNNTTQPATNATSQPTPTAEKPEPARITLAGPIEVRRILKSPQELTRDNWWATLESSPAQRITATDTTRNLSVLADTAEVAGSRQLLTLIATGNAPLDIQSADAGTLTARTLQLDQRSSVARVVGAGTLISQSNSLSQPDAPSRDNETPPPTITWREKAEFTFTRDDPAASSNSKLHLTRAHFLGDVNAASNGALVRANELVTQLQTFKRPPSPATQPNSPLATQSEVTLPTQSQAIGQASVTDAANAFFAADVITVKFTPSADAGSAVPTTFLGSGMATAKIPHTPKPDPKNLTAPQTKDTNPDSTQLAFDHLSAREISGSFITAPPNANKPSQPNQQTTSPQPAQAVTLATLNATGTPIDPVTFHSHDNVRATSLSLAANVPDQVVTLEGTQQSFATLLRDDSRIEGPTIILNGSQRTAQLPTGGRMELRQSEKPESDKTNSQATTPRATLIASATGPITYDESAAIATLSDNVSATLEDATQSSQLNADSVIVTFVMPTDAQTTQAKSNNTSTTIAPSTPFATNAQVASVIATGSINKPAAATITNKPAADNPTDTTATSTYFVEAPRLTALAQQRAFDATGPGRLLAHLGAPEKAGQAQPANATKFEASNAGDTLVQWQTSMSYRENESLAKATGRVRLAHRELTDQTPSLMECETLSLTLAPANQPDQPTPPRDNSAMGALFSNTAFTSALAEGGVWGNLQGQEFSSVTAIYDVTNALLEARGDATTPVTIAAAPAKNNSPATSPLTAARVKITTRDGRVEVIDPGAVQTGPR